MRKAIAFVLRYVSGLLYCLYLFTFGLLFKRHRHLLFQMYCHFNSPVLIVPSVAIEELLQQPLVPVLYEPGIANGNIQVQELVFICSLVHQLQPQSCFEIGTFDGRTTLNVAANAGPDARVYTLDLPRAAMRSTALPLEEDEKLYIDKDLIGGRFAGTEFASRITQLCGDSAAFDFGPYEGKQDFVFVDGSHSYEYVLSDSRAALKLLRPDGGIILWHDYGIWPGVTKALNQLCVSDDAFHLMRHIDGTSLCIVRTAGRALFGRDSS